MVKVLALEGNRIKLSRKALIKEQKAKLAATQGVPVEDGVTTETEESEAAPAPPRPRNEFDERQPRSNQSTILIEGGDDFEDEDGDGDGEEIDEENEPNFNRVDGAPAPAGQTPGGRAPRWPRRSCRQQPPASPASHWRRRTRPRSGRRQQPVSRAAKSNNKKKARRMISGPSSLFRAIMVLTHKAGFPLEFAIGGG